MHENIEEGKKYKARPPQEKGKEREERYDISSSKQEKKGNEKKQVVVCG